MTPPSPPPPAADAWLIYPAAKAFIRACAIVFGACSMLVGFLHIFMAVLVHSTQRAEGFMRTGTWAALLGILSLSCIAMWGSRVLLASRGSRITRVHGPFVSDDEVRGVADQECLMTGGDSLRISRPRKKAFMTALASFAGGIH